MRLTISSAKIQFNEQGTPVATDFDDVYFSNANGLEETNYVFLHNNGLPERWKSCHKQEFVIGETGFGTGLNFLATLAAFKHFIASHKNASLHTLYYISTEKFPLTRTDLTSALANWPDLAEFSHALISQYPIPLNGCHRMTFLSGRVVLDLWLGDVHTSMPQWNNYQNGLVDAWFLDGFAPSKNPDMWTDALFNQMARLSTDACTFATFTAAGIVKRGLRDAGFEVEKRKGFGHKRDMLAGQFQATEVSRTTERYYYRSGSAQINNPRIAIIGGGMAGANCALALARKGLAADVFCKDNEIAQGASGNHQGGFYPQLNADPGIASQIQATGFVYARHLYDQLQAQGFEFAHQWCGVLQVSFNDKVTQRHANLLNKQAWPEHLIHHVDIQQAEHQAELELGYPGLFMPLGGWINPPQLVRALFDYARSLVPLNLHLQKTLQQLSKEQDTWVLNWQDGSTSEYDIVILACGADSYQIEQLDKLPLRQVRGQVELIPSAPPYSSLSTVLCHKGYMTPAYNGGHALGSTYVKGDSNCEPREDEREANLQTHLKALDKSTWVQQISERIQTTDLNQSGSRASTRCSAPDHLPLAGNVPDIEKQNEEYHALYKALPLEKYPFPTNHQNLYMLTGLGSRGLTTAPLMAEVLASQICGHPLPLAGKLLNGLCPNRFLVRNLIRRQ